MADNTCILFDGGKRIKMSTASNPPGNEGIRLTRDADGNWDIIIKARISKDEAKGVIFKFEDLDPGSEPFDKVFPNMIFFTAMDGHGNPVDIKLEDESELLPCFDRDLGGSLILKMNIDNSGKTQNPKTQNART